MAMNFVEGTCPHCGAKTKEDCNTWVYGSPIRRCRKCGQEYLDKRWREVAIDGFDPRSQDASFYMKGALLLAAFTALCAGWMVLQINMKGYYTTRNLACVILGSLGTVLCIFLAIRIKFGFEDKNNAKFMEESKQRLKNPEYVQKLREYGYQIPEDLQ